MADNFFYSCISCVPVDLIAQSLASSGHLLSVYDGLAKAT